MKGVLTCNACNKELDDDASQKLHYKSDWHRYNLKRKVAGVPGVTEALFLARQSALVQERNPLLYSCRICNKAYRTAKAYDQHAKSRTHVLCVSQGSDGREEQAVIKPLPSRRVVVESDAEDEESEESKWEEVDSDDELIREATTSLNNMSVGGAMSSTHNMDEEGDEEEVLDPSCCFMCDQDHDNLDSCVVHMHKHHGFFIPDIEYLKDPEGLLTYLGLKVKRDFMCLYCNDRCHPFSSLEAVRKHMEAKCHCKVHYGDGDDEEEAELEEFYDYSSSYVDIDGNQLVALGDTANTVELGSGGSELILTSRTDKKTSTKTLGSREFLRYYRQKPRPSPAYDNAITTALASRYRSMGLGTVQSREHIVRMK